MNEQERIELQDVMDALTGIKTFIPGTYLWYPLAFGKGQSGGCCTGIWKVVKRTRKTITISRIANKVRHPECDYQKTLTIRVREDRSYGCEVSEKYHLLASYRIKNQTGR